MKRVLSRRNILRGAGVALTLPWMESLAPKAARAQATAFPKRFLAIYLPNGAAELWRPPTAGAGAAWTLGPVLEPLAALKAKMTVLTNLENGSAFNADGSSSVEPSHGRQPGAWLTCVDPGMVRQQLGVQEANAVSVDQLMAQHANFAGLTALPSMQTGLSTVLSYCDGQPCSNSRSVSWSAPTTPMYKLVDPLEVFNRIANVAVPVDPNAPEVGPDPALLARLARNQTVVDMVLENANRTRARLPVSDQLRMDEFLESVHTVEKRVTEVSAGMGGLGCTLVTAPTMATVLPDAPRQNTETYNKGDHADVMNDLLAMAFQCDVTRVITHMLEDERSEFTYDHVTKRTFTEAGSVEGSGTCPEYHGGGQHGSQDDFATITWWNVGKVAALCAKLEAMQDAPGVSILDNTVVFFGGAMHGSNHDCNELPMALIGGGGGSLVMDQHVVLNNRPLRDLHYTLMNHVFGMGATDFGQNLTGAPLQMINEIMAGA